MTALLAGFPVAYTSYHVAIASLAGSALAANPLLAVCASLATTLVVAVLVELVRRCRRRARADLVVEDRRQA
ncbi:MAG: hypothetical protein V4479_03025 [Actinomycetota bacterium]